MTAVAHPGEPRPPLKWVGGKGEFLDRHAGLLPSPDEVTGYREVFCGGGAVFFRRFSGVRPARLSDTNALLIDTYTAVRDHAEELLKALEREQPFYGRDAFLERRASLRHPKRLSLVQRAVAVFVINKWGYNGLWRVNAAGGVNVPFGRPSGKEPPRLYDPENIRACSAALQGVELRCCDFEEALADVAPGEFVYMDPPYAPVSPTASFTSYTAEGFSYGTTPQSALFESERRETDQERLQRVLLHVDARGALFALSNSNARVLAPLRAAWKAKTLLSSRSINCDGNGRGAVTEVLLRNYTRTRRT
ncbi:MAG: DNA adenine methylase [Kofleriaceae bacterium]